MFVDIFLIAVVCFRINHSMRVIGLSIGVRCPYTFTVNITIVNSSGSIRSLLAYTHAVLRIDVPTGRNSNSSNSLHALVPLLPVLGVTGFTIITSALRSFVAADQRSYLACPDDNQGLRIGESQCEVNCVACVSKDFSPTLSLPCE
jgi:hypothetical protein